MAAAIAHEVKNPLAGIEVMAGLLQRRLPDHPEAQAMLTDIINEAKMANAIVIEVLDFVRPIRLQVEPVPIARAAARRGARRRDDGAARRHGAAHRRARVAAARSKATAASCGSCSRTWSRTPSRRSTAAARSRSRRSTCPATMVPAATALAAMPTVVIDVADDGPGIPEDLRDRIFNPFFTTKPRGSGLGLAIVRKIVDAHDGRITVGAPPSGGARFRVVLPLHGLPDRTRSAGAPGWRRPRRTAQAMTPRE